MKIMKTQIMRIILSFFLVLTLSELSCNHPLEETTIISETVETTELLVPNSEMIHIIFSLNWILKNDVEPDPNTVKITFPISWVSDAPTVLDGDKPIELNVPKQLFDDHNESKDPSLVTAVFPNDYFKGLPVATKLPDVSPSPQLIISPPCMNFYTVPGGSPGSEVFLISAISGPLDWSLTKDATWLAISKKQGGLLMRMR